MDKIYREDVIMTLKHCLPDGIEQNVAVKNVQRISSVEIWHKVCANDLPEKGRMVIGAQINEDKEPCYIVSDTLIKVGNEYKLLDAYSYLTINYWMYVPDIGE